ncbi:MAG: transcription termination/antitermination protein NusG [Muribaculaceae bacterium]|nr:transcription termination/antitermination protein NusG [Muribaculaceae bacterium]MDE6448413.1 transcription termination/antitermination protein NusG [Muribaculaceae bacterium]
MASEKKEWYVLRAISGKEAKVKEVLDAQIKNTNLGRYVFQVLIPTEKVLTTRNGKKVVKERTLYSGYVFVQADLTGEVEYELRNTTNVIDFLRGRAKGAKPETLREAEVMRMLGRADDLQQPVDEVLADFEVGEAVKVLAGPFSGFSAVISEVNTERRKLKVEVKIFGRGTELELDYSQVEKE